MDPTILLEYNARPAEKVIAHYLYTLLMPAHDFHSLASSTLKHSPLKDSPPGAVRGRPRYQDARIEKT